MWKSWNRIKQADTSAYLPWCCSKWLRLTPPPDGKVTQSSDFLLSWKLTGFKYGADMAADSCINGQCVRQHAFFPQGVRGRNQGQQLCKVHQRWFLLQSSGTPECFFNVSARAQTIKNMTLFYGRKFFKAHGRKSIPKNQPPQYFEYKFWVSIHQGP